ELERLLHDGPVDGALFDPGQSRVFFVEGDDLHLADFAGLFDRAQNGRTVVRPESDHSGDVGILDQCICGVPFGVHAFATVGADVYDLDLRAFERLLQSAIAILRVLRVHCSDEDHDLASLGQHIFDQLASLTARGFVIGADVTGAIAAWRVAILREDQRLTGRAVDQLRLILGVNRADGYPVYALRQQVVNYSLLTGGREFGIDLEFDLDVGQFRLSLLGPFARDRPKIRRVIGDERDPRLFGPARPVARSVRQNQQ